MRSHLGGSSVWAFSSNSQYSSRNSGSGCRLTQPGRQCSDGTDNKLIFCTPLLGRGLVQTVLPTPIYYYLVARLSITFFFEKGVDNRGARLYYMDVDRTAYTKQPTQAGGSEPSQEMEEKND